ncbi:hypothetical protein [Oceanobacillus damuensis]|uniref:hypothetical protein n=1 Tax=Oceanobacillus damuensis TaxID=937928 RepID=UPI00082EB2BA|nr:hypothetical protein [Oceanobacillus damuensis]
MNTQSASIPFLPEGDYEFIFEDLELVFPKGQLANITLLWNNGTDITAIADKYERDPLEIFLALIHLASKKKLKKAFNNPSTLLVPGKEQLKRGARK